MDGHNDVQLETIIPYNYLIVGYQKENSNFIFSKLYILGYTKRDNDLYFYIPLFQVSLKSLHKQYVM